MEASFNTPLRGTKSSAGGISPLPLSASGGRMPAAQLADSPMPLERSPSSMLSSSPFRFHGSPSSAAAVHLASGATTPMHVHHDRYISSPGTQDPTLSSFLLTTNENKTPMALLRGDRSSMRRVDAHEICSTSPHAGGSRLGSRRVGGRRGATPADVSPTSPLMLDSARRRLGVSGGVVGEHRGGGGGGVRGSSFNDVFTKLRLDAREDGRSPSGDHPCDVLLRGEDEAATSPNMMEAEPYTTKLARTLFGEVPQTTVLGIHQQTGETSPARCGGGAGGGDVLCYDGGEEERFASTLGVVYEANRARNFRSKSFRVIAQTPERILDAAGIIDDFYLNLVDWGSRNVLCVALKETVYLWDASTYAITSLPSFRDDSDDVATDCVVSGVNWAPDGRHLAVGLSDGRVELWDVEAQQRVRELAQHSARVGSMSWLPSSGSVLATGSKDATIRVQDLREHVPTCELRGHQNEVCGLKWSPNGIHLASGGNDNQLLVWDRRLLHAGTSSNNSHTTTTSSSSPSSPAPSSMTSPNQPVLFLNKHTAAVKALAWNPVHTSLLASGGGTEDKRLRFWNITSGECVHEINTHSQVCGVLWSHTGTELVSSHGFSMNQLTIWRYPSLRRVADLCGHTSRVLHTCMSSDGEVIVSAAGDETIRFWRCFPPREVQQSASGGSFFHYPAAAAATPTSTATTADAMEMSSPPYYTSAGDISSARTPPPPPPPAAMMSSSMHRHDDGMAMHSDPYYDMVSEVALR